MAGVPRICDCPGIDDNRIIAVVIRHLHPQRIDGELWHVVAERTQRDQRLDGLRTRSTDAIQALNAACAAAIVAASASLNSNSIGSGSGAGVVGRAEATWMTMPSVLSYT